MEADFSAIMVLYENVRWTNYAVDQPYGKFIFSMNLNIMY